MVFTLGTSTRSAEEFLDLLAHYGIETLVDVRRFPTSRFEHFKGENLAALLAGEGIEYVYLGEELGGYRAGGYEAYTASEAFARGLERLEALAATRRVAVACSERLPWKCHRRFIGRALAQRGWEVRHIIDIGREWVPR
ncbi:MAG TPA: DUF488 domain-containing protein [Anaerolineae bacterium]|nr:DUF488 domain-containing protein [Anaerolineae bacterium]